MKKLITLILLAAVTSANAELPYAGASVGYLIDSEEAYFAARIGVDVAQVHGLTHSVEVEVGLASLDESGAGLDLIPVMANYRLASVRERQVGFYAGAGLGTARLKASVFGFDDSAWTFAAQAFGGVQYNVTPVMAITAGLRYIWVDDVDLYGSSIDVGDDVSVEVGVRFRF